MPGVFVGFMAGGHRPRIRGQAEVPDRQDCFPLPGPRINGALVQAIAYSGGCRDWKGVLGRVRRPACRPRRPLMIGKISQG